MAQTIAARKVKLHDLKTKFGLQQVYVDDTSDLFSLLNRGNNLYSVLRCLKRLRSLLEV